MSRSRNTNVRGGGFTATQIEAVWGKGRVIAGCDPRVWRRDACGYAMRRAEYGQQNKHGSEIDHIKPVSKGGGDELSNRQPLQWEVNRYKGDTWPQWACPIAA